MWLSSCFALAIHTSLIAGSGQSGAPGDSTCAACHGASTTPLASQVGGNGVFMTFSGGSTYTPGVTESITVTVIDQAFMSFGYQTSPRIQGQDATQGAGTLIPVDASVQFYPATGNSTLEWIAANEGVDGPTPNVFHFKWTPPASGTVVFYIIGMGANGSGGPEPNEHVYANTYTLAFAPPPPPPVKPTFAPSGVRSAAANIAGLAPGAWVSISGQNLSETTSDWSAADFSAGKLPTALGNVTVTIDGKPAAVSSVNPTQIILQVPDDAARGTVPVVVTRSGVSSDPVLVNMSSIAPSLFTQDGTYLLATHADGSLVTAGTPAHPGEMIGLFGTGFGPTSPPTLSGLIVSQPRPLDPSATLSASIGGVGTQVAVAEMMSAGLYYLSFTVPALIPDGDAIFVVTIDGVQTQDGVLVAIHE